MAVRSYSLLPKKVPRVRTRHRRIVTRIPVPQSLPILRTLRRCEPVSMSGQPLVVWDRAEGVHVFDRWGNRWLDWSSGVLVANAGHGRRPIADAVVHQARRGLLHNYCFPSEGRARLVAELARLAPRGLDKVFLLTTGSEAVEAAIKMARAHGVAAGGPRKIGIVSFERAFHGRTLGAQMVGGIPALKEWIVRLDPTFVQVPFPDGFRTPDTSFAVFERALRARGVRPDRIAGVLTETFQGGGASFAPRGYMKALRGWCDRHKVVLILDEIQAAFGRTGRRFGFEHYGIVPDLLCLGKGITSSLPLSAVMGRRRIMDLFPPNAMTSTHSGSPIPVAACRANLDLIRRERLVENARRMGEVLHTELRRIAARFPAVVGAVHGRGLVAGVHLVKAGSSTRFVRSGQGGREPDGDLAWDVVRRCVEKGLLLFAPVGFGGGTVKICPPLVIRRDAIVEGASVLEEAIAESLGIENGE